MLLFRHVLRWLPKMQATHRAIRARTMHGCVVNYLRIRYSDCCRGDIILVNLQIALGSCSREACVTHVYVVIHPNCSGIGKAKDLIFYLSFNVVHP